MAASIPAEKKLSLRERNRLRTRDAIADAAVQMGMRMGIQAMRVEDIAEQAGVSTRTFNNYFSNKYEALAARHVERMHHAANALRQRPDDEPLWDSIRYAMTALWHEKGLENHVAPPTDLAELRLLHSNRNVQAEILRGISSDDNEFAAAIQAKLPDVEDAPIYARQLAAAVTAVTQVSFDIFLTSSSTYSSIFKMIDDSLTRLQEGFQQLPGASE